MASETVKTAPVAPKQQVGALPASVTGPVDLGRLIRELEKLDEALDQEHLRGAKAKTEPHKVSKLLEITAQLNSIDTANKAQRKNLHDFLAQVRSSAPVVHMSFSADPSPQFVEKIVAWLRKEIHAQLLLTIGLQPNIGAGFTLRTTNRYFDFSLRKNFEAKSDLFMKSLKETA